MKPPRKLIDEWYKKLEKSGFKDIEVNYHGEKEPMLKKWSAELRRQDSRRHPVRVAAKEAYYRQCYQYTFVHKFDTGVDRAIWAAHAEGLTSGQIKAKLALKLTGPKISALVKSIEVHMTAYFKREREY